MKTVDPSEPKVFTVAELTRRLRAVIEATLGEVWIEGEISNLARPASGHVYFTLKDETAQIGAVLFRREAQTLPVRLADGMQVRVFGSLTVYEKAGRYQVLVRRIETGGVGALRAAFEALKNKLRAEGLFDAERKRPLPLLVRHIGVVTSPSGAAIRDILKVLTRRFPNLRVTLAPVPVQGLEAAGCIAAAIDDLNRIDSIEVLIVGRGGGSVEDLQAFNEETVARAIARSARPVISAVGHEIDVTISDFVADVRAPTPSAAAEIVVNRKDAFEESLRGLDRRLMRALREAVLQAHHRKQVLRERLAAREPRRQTERIRHRIVQSRLRLRHALERSAAQTAQGIDETALRLAQSLDRRLQLARRRLDTGGARLLAYDPMAVLRRGYSLTTDSTGSILRTTDGLAPGVRVRTRLAQGRFEAEVTSLEHPTSDR